MDLAYDKQLNIIVTATDACKSHKWSSMYECPYCKRPVILISSGGQFENRRAYFRHQRGSYADDCEKYASVAYAYYKSHDCSFKGLLPNSGCKTTVSLNRENGDCSFSVDIMLSAEFLQQMRRQILSYCTLFAGKTLESLHQYEISGENFIANVECKKRLNILGDEILVKIGTDEHRISFLQKDVTFFDIQQNVDLYTKCDYSAKRVDNGSIFVGKEYVIVSKYDVSKAPFLNVELSLHDVYDGYFIIGVLANEYSEPFANFCHQFGYSLHPREESIEILWPPAFPDKNGYVTNDSVVYLYSSIDLKSETNFCGSIVSIGANLWCTDISTEIKILLNQKIISVKSAVLSNQTREKFLALTVEKVSDRNIKFAQDVFLVCRDAPVTLVKSGQSIWLTNDTEIYLYESNYLKKIIRAEETNARSTKYDLPDIFRHSKAFVPLKKEDLNYIGTDEIMIRYLDQCRRTGKINPAVQKLLTKE